MTTRSGTPYHAQGQSSAPMDQNFETMMKILNDQMTRLNHNLGEKLNQTTQDMAHQFTQINARLNRIEPKLDTISMCPRSNWIGCFVHVNI